MFHVDMPRPQTDKSLLYRVLKNPKQSADSKLSLADFEKKTFSTAQS